VLSFDGVNDALASTSALSAFTANNGATIIAALKPTAIDADKNIFADSSSQLILKTFTTDSGIFRLTNDDGGADSIDIAGSNITTILSARLDGAKIFIRNGTANASAASGNTAALTGTMQIGGTWGGLLGRLTTYNKKLYHSDVNTIEEGLATRFGASRGAWIAIEQ
jgi:hypothetical protein